MGNWSGLFISLARPLLVKVLAALGMGAISYAGVNQGMDILVSAIRSNISGIPSELSGLMGLTGIYTAFSMILGALAFRMTMQVFNRIGVMTK